jgi:hypothetical protein
MPNEERMTLNERWNYLRLVKKRYLKASKVEPGWLLDEMEAITGLHRKSLIRLTSGSLERKPRHEQRGRTCGPEVDHASEAISASHDHICAERLQRTLVGMATHLARHGQMEASPRLLNQLSRISVSTVRRVLKRLQQDEPRLPREGPAEANKAAREMPMRGIRVSAQMSHTAGGSTGA